VGRIEEVVVEGPSKRDPAVTTGRTRQNKLVHFATADPLRVGTLAQVEVTEARTHYLLGRLVEVLMVPRRRVRIPVVAG
jgi:tRNA-2-methylthio-N6-dimethylallyladenosine synthase